MSSIVPTIPLPSGSQIFAIGLGVWQAKAQDTLKAVGWVLKVCGGLGCASGLYFQEPPFETIDMC